MGNSTISRFLGNYTLKLESYIINPAVRTRYVRHAQHYIAADQEWLWRLIQKPI